MVLKNDKRGIAFLFTLMLGVTIIVLGMGLAQPTKQFVDDARNVTNLNCTNPLISKWDEGTCVALDSLKPFVTGGLILIGLAIISAKVVFGG